jgi:hypothetical protein
MEKLKLLIAIGLCVALMMFPLAGMAGNPLPVNNSADGHPWDDGDNSTGPEDPENPSDTVVEVVNATAGPDITGKPLRSSVNVVFVWKWYLILIW